MQLEQNLEHFRSRGLEVCAISPDTVDILNNFSNRAGVGIPLLADSEARTIADFGILRSTWTGKPGNLPNPGTFVVDREGVVTYKDFKEKIHERINLDDMLVTRLGGDPMGEGFSAETEHLTLTVRSASRTVYAANVFTLLFDIAFKPDMHIYTPEVGEGYIPVAVALEETDLYAIRDAEYRQH